MFPPLHDNLECAPPSPLVDGWAQAPDRQAMLPSHDGSSAIAAVLGSEIVSEGASQVVGGGCGIQIGAESKFTVRIGRRRSSSNMDPVRISGRRPSNQEPKLEAHHRWFRSVQSHARQFERVLTTIGSAWEDLMAKERNTKVRWAESTAFLAEKNREATETNCKLEHQLHSLEVQIEQLEERQSFGGDYVMKNFRESSNQTQNWMFHVEAREAEHTIFLEKFKSEFHSAKGEATMEQLDLQEQLSEAEACLCHLVPADQIELAEARLSNAETEVCMGEKRCMRAERDLCQLQLELEEETAQADSAQSSLVDLITACSEEEAQCRELHAKSESCEMRRSLAQALKLEREELLSEGEEHQASFTKLQKQFTDLFVCPKSTSLPPQRKRTVSKSCGVVSKLKGDVSHRDLSLASVSTAPSMQAKKSSCPNLPNMRSQTPVRNRSVLPVPQRLASSSAPSTRSDSLVVTRPNIPLALPVAYSTQKGHRTVPLVALPVARCQMAPSNIPLTPLSNNDLTRAHQTSLVSTSPYQPQWSTAANSTSSPVAKSRIVAYRSH